MKVDNREISVVKSLSVVQHSDCDRISGWKNVPCYYFTSNAQQNLQAISTEASMCLEVMSHTLLTLPPTGESNKCVTYETKN